MLKPKSSAQPARFYGAGGGLTAATKHHRNYTQHTRKKLHVNTEEETHEMQVQLPNTPSVCWSTHNAHTKKCIIAKSTYQIVHTRHALVRKYSTINNIQAKTYTIHARHAPHIKCTSRRHDECVCIFPLTHRSARAKQRLRQRQPQMIAGMDGWMDG